MDTESTFDDQAQIDLIKERLWSERELGRAAVMIGSGFSRNADVRSSTSSLFPLWSGLTSEMLDRLYPKESTPESERKWRERRYKSAAGAMRLADEYAALFGREALNDLLVRLIPDDGFRPGHLHRLLLSLPWSDVFTTNYDTLLEKAAQGTYERKYDVVASPADIPAQERPRIVKLHGSFPHQRPFIITEEDFRTYPERFAPFVNLVQQSSQENVLVLLGFSGEDPNFLSWTGWVRDNLGDNAPAVYLCGLLDLSSSERQLLDRRKVVPVDLSPLFPAMTWPDRDERHRKAAEWFLLNLMSGRPPNPDDWLGKREQSGRWTPSFGLPQLPQPRSFVLQKTTILTPFTERETEQTKEIIEVWRAQRDEYPGWAVAPREKRERLVSDTEHWIYPVLKVTDNTSPQEGIHLLYELNWRLERALVPLFADWVERIEPVLEHVNPYPTVITDADNADVTPAQTAYRGLDWGLLAERWVELAFALIRVAREGQNETSFRRWINRINQVVDRKPGWRARALYEECQYHLFRGELDGLRERLDEWPEELDEPGWDLKRAALFAELGQVQEANRLAEGCLERIRGQLEPGTRDLALLSREGWAIALLRVIQPNLPGRARSWGDLRERLRQLEPLNCNPFPELEQADLILKSPTPEERADANRQVVQRFDPGLKTTTVRHDSGLSVTPFFPAFGFARMLEEGGLPLRGGNVVVQKEAALNAARWIEPYAPLWSLSILIRSVKISDGMELDDRFGRVRVATVDEKEVERLYDTFAQSWVQAIRYLTSNPQELTTSTTGFAERLVRVLSDVLSRLSIRFDKPRRSQMLDLALQMYELPLFRQTLKLHDSISLVLGRLLSQAMDRDEVLSHMDRLLSLPVPGETGFTVAEPSKWPEPLDYLAGWSAGGGLPSEFDRSSWTPEVARLTSLLRDGSAQVRSRAALRLVSLLDIGALTDDEKTAFGEALWSRTGSVNGLPAETGTFAFSFLSLPHPPNIDIQGKVRDHLLTQDFKRAVNNGSVVLLEEDFLAREFRGGTTPLIAMTEEEHRSLVLDLSPAEAEATLQKLHSLWNSEKQVVRQRLGSSFVRPNGGLAGRFSDWVHLLAEVILPRLPTVNQATKELAARFVDELDEAGVQILYTLPALLYLDGNRSYDVANRLWSGMESEESDEAKEAIRGIVLWVTFRARGAQIPAPPDHLLDEVVSRTVARKMPGLDTALIHLTNLLRLHPEQLRARHLNDLCKVLRYLRIDTRLPSVQEQRELGSMVDKTIQVSERPRYRALGASLASGLAAHYSNENLSDPEILNQWKETSNNDTLPEVRVAWHKEDEVEGA